MNKKNILILTCATALLPLVAHADAGSWLDAYYVPSLNIKASAAGTSGSAGYKGYGARGLAEFQQHFDLTGEYEKISGKGSNDADGQQTRLGGGLQTAPGPVRGGIYGEYIYSRASAGGNSTNADGYGLHLQLSADLMPGLTAYGRVGRVDLKNKDTDAKAIGPEYRIGMTFMGPTVGLFTEYRIDRSSSGGVDTDAREFRVGLRFPF
ncbi:MAG: hypothetical protein ACRESS_06875 [Stenotrophobium sp.]